MASMLSILVALSGVLTLEAHLISPDQDPVQTQPWSNCLGASNCAAGLQYRRVSGRIQFHPCSGKCSDDGAYTEWSEWSSCSVSCGEGRKQRMRFCTDPQPTNGGKSCPEGVVQEEFENCNTTCVQDKLPVDGNYTEWTEFHPCSATCGNGTRVRERFCVNPPPSYGGADCPNGLMDTEREQCMIQPCVDGGYSDWTPEVCRDVNGCPNIVCTSARYCIDPPPLGGMGCANGTVDIRTTTSGASC